ncbi:MAG: hypothetical protein DBY45_06605, partial [Clostridiales bacterium]
MSAALRAFPAVQTISYRRTFIGIPEKLTGISEKSHRDFLTVVEPSPFREMRGRGLAADWALPRQTHKPGAAAFRTMETIAFVSPCAIPPLFSGFPLRIHLPFPALFWRAGFGLFQQFEN